MNDGDWLETEAWVNKQWGQVDFGDYRRKRRVIKFATQLAQHPGKHLPTACEDFASLKAAYRLLDNEKVKVSALNQGVWTQTLKRASTLEGVVLFVQDGTNLDFTSHPYTQGLGMGGNEKQRSLLMQTTLCVQPQGHQSQLRIIGVASQQTWTRTESRKKETRKAKNERWNEGDVWTDSLESCQTPPTGSFWVSVSDRGSDDFSYFLQADESGWKFVARAARSRRVLLNGQAAHLFPAIRQQPSQGQVALHLRGRQGKPKRTVMLNISFTPITLLPPPKSPDRGAEPLAIWVVRAWSDDGDLEWILLTNVPVESFEDAVQIVNWYAHRWVVEEFHKALKTGCRFEESQLQRVDRLQRLLALLSPIAARLLALRTLSRTSPDSLACDVIPLELIALVIRKIRAKVRPKKWTLREFWHGVARIGGFIGRKSDGEPGWQTLWGGWTWLLEAAWIADLSIPDSLALACG